jgi:hypothetical protein
MIAMVLLGWPLSGYGQEKPGLELATYTIPMTHPIQEGEGIANRIPSQVFIARQGNAFRLYRDGKPYFIKGIGGRGFLESAASAGANSVRTWGAQETGPFLDRAHRLNMTVTVGIWLSQDPADYNNPDYRNKKKADIYNLVAHHNSHPALLAWALGNEINLDGADNPTAWRFVNELAEMIKGIDDHHPVITVIACNESTLGNIAAFAPALDAVGINAYGALSQLREILDHSAYEGPYLITEWGVTGHWEAQQTAWGRPIEPNSTWKADFQLSRYQHDILANRDRCIGSYVFLWGQKQERTPTWYSMIMEDLPGLTGGLFFSPAVDVMHFNWTGSWPENRAPEVEEMLINGVTAESNIALPPGAPIVSQILVWDPDNDPLIYVWELLEEPRRLGTGGSQEARPFRLATVRHDDSSQVNLNAPLNAGEYRLFVYVLDNQGHTATANIPFQVN